MEKKQLSAVEWLVAQLSSELNYSPVAQHDRVRDVIKRALEMEREQKAEIIKNIRSYGK